MLLFHVVEAQTLCISEMIRVKWMTIPAGEGQFIPDFEPGASCLLCDLGSYLCRNGTLFLGGRFRAQGRCMRAPRISPVIR